jgi:hypothetical protein
MIQTTCWLERYWQVPYVGSLRSCPSPLWNYLLVKWPEAPWSRDLAYKPSLTNCTTLLLCLEARLWHGLPVYIRGIDRYLSRLDDAMGQDRCGFILFSASHSMDLDNRPLAPKCPRSSWTSPFMTAALGDPLMTWAFGTLLRLWTYENTKSAWLFPMNVTKPGLDLRTDWVCHWCCLLLLIVLFRSVFSDSMILGLLYMWHYGHYWIIMFELR